MVKHRPHLIVILTILWLMTPTTYAWWWDDNDQQEEITRLHGEVDQEEQSRDDWQGIASALGVGCVITLVAGAAIGSKGRKAANGRQ